MCIEQKETTTGHRTFAERNNTTRNIITFFLRECEEFGGIDEKFYRDK